MTERKPRGDHAAPERGLVVAARSGDGAAFRELLRICDRAVRATAWRLLGDADLVDDVLQESYLKAYRSLDRFDPGGAATFGSWLHHIVHSAAVDHHRRVARRPQSVGPIDERMSKSLSTTVESDVAQRTALRQAFADLAPPLAAAVALVDGEGYSQAEAAAFLGLSTSTLSRHVNQGRSQLRSRLTNEGVMP